MNCFVAKRGIDCNGQPHDGWLLLYDLLSLQPMEQR